MKVKGRRPAARSKAAHSQATDGQRSGAGRLTYSCRRWSSGAAGPLRVSRGGRSRRDGYRSRAGRSGKPALRPDRPEEVPLIELRPAFQGAARPGRAVHQILAAAAAKPIGRLGMGAAFGAAGRAGLEADGDQDVLGLLFPTVGDGPGFCAAGVDGRPRIGCFPACARARPC